MSTAVLPRLVWCDRGPTKSPACFAGQERGFLPADLQWLDVSLTWHGMQLPKKRRCLVFWHHFQLGDGSLTNQSCVGKHAEIAACRTEPDLKEARSSKYSIASKTDEQKLMLQV